jgi:hypothetical protein
MVRGKQGIVPHCVKSERITQIQNIFNYKIFIETGTYMGDMIYAQKKNFSLLYTIELSSNLSGNAKQRFERYRNIHVYNGDSGVLLTKIVRKIKEPSIFWLDAHYSGGVTKRNNVDTPIVTELKAILKLSSSDHIILIDDARLFTGKNDYPTIQTLISLVKKYRSSSHIYIKYDIIHIYL